MPKVLILRIGNENENYERHTDYALLPLNDEMVSTILARSDDAKKEKMKDDDFSEICFKSPVYPVCVSEDALEDVLKDVGIKIEEISDVKFLDFPLEKIKEIPDENEISIPKFRFWHDGDVSILFFENDQSCYSEMFNPQNLLK